MGWDMDYMTPIFAWRFPFSLLHGLGEISTNRSDGRSCLQFSVYKKIRSLFSLIDDLCVFSGKGRWHDPATPRSQELRAKGLRDKETALTCFAGECEMSDEDEVADEKAMTMTVLQTLLLVNM
jgi:hypothetical protein